MSRFPSIQNVLKAIKETILRFPLEIIIAIIGTSCAIILLQKEFNEEHETLFKILLSSALCLVGFLAISLYFASSKKSHLLRFLVSLIIGSLLFLFVFSFEKRFAEIDFQKFFVLNIALHLLVSFAGFISIPYKQDQFWEFNKQLFLRILTSVLYSGVLFAGIALAILAVEKLFNFDFDDKIYGYLFFVIAGIFNTVFFLSGVPQINSDDKPLVLNYPKGLKNFTQYVLIPLISLYLVILICYEAKILITFSLPAGWVSNLVLVFALAGILSFLLIHSLANQNGNLWMKQFNRWFYFALIPLLGLLFWAILYRVIFYGITHERYYVLLLSVWLTIVVIYFLVRKEPQIKFIPVTLCIAGLLSVFGPQSAGSVSKYSQLSRFKMYLQKAETKKLSFEEEQDLSSIVDFLENNYGVNSIIPFSKGKLKSFDKEKDNEYVSADAIMTALGFEYHSPYDKINETDKSLSYYSYNSYSDYIENTHGYDFMFTLNTYNNFECDKCITIDNKTFSIESKETDYGQDLKINGNIIPLKINAFVSQNTDFKTDHRTNKPIIQNVETQKYALSMEYISANGNSQNGKNILDNYEIKIKVKIKK